MARFGSLSLLYNATTRASPALPPSPSPLPMLSLNELARRRCQTLAEHFAERLHVHAGVLQMDCGARVIDCGVQASGGLEVGRQLAEICLADLGRVSFVPGTADLWPGVMVALQTDQPVAACMASQ